MLYRFLILFFSLVLRIAFRYEIVNRPKKSPGTPLLVCANHLSLIDIVSLACAYPDRLYFVAKEELNHVFLFSAIFRHLGTIFVDRESNDIDAMRQMLSLLKEDKKLAIFPEGTRVKSIDPRNMKEGIGLLAQRAGVPIQCVQLDAHYHFRGSVRVIFKELYVPEKLPLAQRRAQRQEIVREVFNRIYDRKEPLEAFQEEKHVHSNQ